MKKLALNTVITALIVAELILIAGYTSPVESSLSVVIAVVVAILFTVKDKISGRIMEEDPADCGACVPYMDEPGCVQAHIPQKPLAQTAEALNDESMEERYMTLPDHIKSLYLAYEAAKDKAMEYHCSPFVCKEDKQQAADRMRLTYRKFRQALDIYQKK